MFLAQGGCAALQELGVPEETRESLRRGQEALAQSDYEGSLNEYQRVLILSPGRRPADEALFYMGLIYAHPGNPKKDYAKALGSFRSLIRDYPQSRRIEQAKVWVGVLEANEKLTQANEKLSEMLERLKKVDMEIEQKRREKGH